MKTITVRGIDPELDHCIKLNADENKLSINQWILQTLRNAMGLKKKTVFRKYHDLDRLAGGWSRKELADFNRNAELFEKIDREIWK